MYSGMVGRRQWPPARGPEFKEMGLILKPGYHRNSRWGCDVARRKYGEAEAGQCDEICPNSDWPSSGPASRMEISAPWWSFQGDFSMCSEGVKTSIELCQDCITLSTEQGFGRGRVMHCEDKSCAGRRQWPPLRKHDIKDQPIHSHQVRKQ